MRKIYIVNDSGHDFSSANSYNGEFIILTSGKVNVFASDRIKREIEMKMNEAQAGDLLLLSGNSILNVLSSMVLMSKIDEVGFLLYNFNTEKYEKRKFNLLDFGLQRITKNEN